VWGDLFNRLKLGRLKSDRGEIWQVCSSSKYISIDRVGNFRFLNRYNFKAISMPSYHRLTINFLQHDGIACYAERCISYDRFRLSVRPSVRIVLMLQAWFQLFILISTSRRLLCLILTPWRVFFTVNSTLQDICICLSCCTLAEIWVTSAFPSNRLPSVPDSIFR